MKKTVIIFLLFTSFCFGQSEEEKQIMELYKQNYQEWIVSEQVQSLLEKDPELKKMIQDIPIWQTKAYKDSQREIEERKNEEIDFKTLFSEKGFDMTIDLITDALSVENSQVIYNMYWKIIKSEKSEKVGHLILDHMKHAQKQIENAIKENINFSQN